MLSWLAITARRLLIISGLTSIAGPVAAQSWTDWTSITTGSPGTATGTMSLSGSSVTVSYAGQALGGSQTACGIGWLASTFAAYDGIGLDASSYNSPPECDMIQVESPGSYVLSFSRPVVNPWMAFVSVGQPSVPVFYDFVDAPFEIIDEGQGPWGDGSLTGLAGDVLDGREGHGVIRFTGTYTSLSWTTTPVEFWHGFTVGGERLETGVVPEPMSMVLLGTGLLGLAAARRVRKR